MPKPDKMRISPKFRRGDFPRELRREDMILIFEDRITGWMLTPAERLLEQDPESGFAALAIITTYFEMITKYQGNVEPLAFTEPGSPAERGTPFQNGFRAVFAARKPQLDDHIPELYYFAVRNALYHAGFPTTKIAIDDKLPRPFRYHANSAIALTLNPKHIVLAIQGHFARYIAQLRAPAETDLQSKFEARFKLDNG